MQKPQPLRFLHVRLTRLFVQQFPASAELLGNLGVVHVRRDFGDLPAFDLRPDHEGVHGPLDVIGGLFALSGVRVRGGGGRIDLERAKISHGVTVDDDVVVVIGVVVVVVEVLEMEVEGGKELRIGVVEGASGGVGGNGTAEGDEVVTER